jgi:hypothetical protein
VGVGAYGGWRPAVALCGDIVGVVRAAGASLWLAFFAGPGGQRVGRATVGGAFATLGIGWRSATAADVHRQRVVASGLAADVIGVVVKATATGVGWRPTPNVGASGHMDAAGGRATFGAYTIALCWLEPGCCCMCSWTHSSTLGWCCSWYFYKCWSAIR